ncbi:MAG: DUF222 domain-containing protein [Candidatus Dormibacteria bacterium]
MAEVSTAAVTSPAIGHRFVALQRAVDDFAERPEALHTAEEIGEQIVFITHCTDRLKLEVARLVGVFARTHEAERQGSNDVVDWVRHHARTSAAEALSLRAVGAQVPNLPASTLALERGQIGFGHVVQVAHNAAFSEKSKTGAFDERELLDHARVESVGRFRRTCQSFRHIQDAAGVVESEKQAVEFRNLTFNATDDGRCFVNVELDSLAYVAAMTAIDARSDRLGRQDHRLKCRRRADGFVEMCMDDMAASAKSGASLSPVHIAISCSCATYHNQPGAPAAETEYGAMLSGAAIGRLSCDASITHIKLNEKLLPVGMSRLKRQLSKREMRILRQLHPRCVRPGCRRPASQCEAHHITWWSRGGKSLIEDMCMVCPFHHFQVHEGGWQMAKREEGGFVWIPPQFSRGPTALLAA